jgi:hypothetical protein
MQDTWRSEYVPDTSKGHAIMSSFFTLRVDLEYLTDAMYAFVTDPLPSRNERPVIQELGDINQDLVDVLECMVLDGTEARQDVADFAQAVFGANGMGPLKDER